MFNKWHQVVFLKNNMLSFNVIGRIKAVSYLPYKAIYAVSVVIGVQLYYYVYLYPIMPYINPIRPYAVSV